MTERDAELRAIVGYNVKRANSVVSAGVERLLGPFGLRRTTFSALSVIAGNAGIRQSDVAEVLAIERPNLVQILDELKRAGWIERARDCADRRVYRLNVTEAGAARLEEAAAALRAYDARLTRGLTAEERDALITALRRVEENGSDLLDEKAWEGGRIGDLSTT